MYHILTNSSLSFVLEGAEQVAALRAKVSVEKTDIISIEWVPAFTDWHNWEIRMPGTYVPRWLMAGSYWTAEGWDFVYAKKPRSKMMQPILHDVLVITTKKDRYKRIILGMSKDKAKPILEWWNEQ